MKKILVALTFAALSTSAFAQVDVIKQRQDGFKALGGASRTIGGILRNEQPYNDAAVKAALQTIITQSKALPALFPAGSDKGAETAALPIIWNEKDKFNAMFAKLDADATAALASVKDDASFRAAMPALVRNCGGCHDTYRMKK